MKKLLVLLGAGALALSACTPATTSTGSGTNTASTVTLAGTKALNVAADAYTGVATLVTAGVENNVFSGEQLFEIQRLNDQALDVLRRGASGLTEAQRAEALLGITAKLRLILKAGEQK